MWRGSVILALVVQFIGQALFLFLLEPGYDLSKDGYRAVKAASLVYFLASLTAGLLFFQIVTIGMALLAVAAALLLAIALWHHPAPVRSVLKRLR